MKQAFIDKNFRADKLELLTTINDILDNYMSQGYNLTLRQIYYRLIALDLFPDDRRWRRHKSTRKWVRDPKGTKNANPNYKWLGDLVKDARLAGLIDWDMIVDRERKTVEPSRWESPAEIVEAAAATFAIDKWKNQSNHIEVMVEKRALEGILIPVCNHLGVNFTANKGYSSESFMYRMGRRIRNLHQDEDKRIHVLYLGDHDPSGMDMDRDIEERLELFSGYPVTFQRLALRREQVEELQLPESPAKPDDSRAAKYIAKYGGSSWELDAVEPQALDQLVTDAVDALRDEDKWEEALAKERPMKAAIRKMAVEYRRKEKAGEVVSNDSSNAPVEDDYDTFECPACGSTDTFNTEVEDDEVLFICNNCGEEW